MATDLATNDAGDSAPQGAGASAIEQLATHHIARKIQAGHILNWNGAQHLHIDQLATANRLNLTENDKARITPFPQPSTNVRIDGSVNDRLVSIVEQLLRPKPQQQPPTEPTPTTPEPSEPPAQAPAAKRKLWPWLLAAALAGGGTAGSYYAWDWWNQPAETVPGDVGADMGVTIR